ncbi:MAG TPA: tol-pal system-associated acyl-CoA thioesterase [Gammaproteobacteria bacterium]|nr:tol-pal system-associated acyl-CoA thioesterase [Gammaproteobacteria bacterium]
MWPVRVYYEDTDSGGVVYYANYLKFMERARTEWLRALGYEQTGLVENEELIFAVRRAELDYLRPARFDDLLQVSVRVLRCGRASIEFVQVVMPDQGEEVLCHGRIKIACLNVTTFKPRTLPSQMLNDIRQFMHTTREQR